MNQHVGLPESTRWQLVDEQEGFNLVVHKRVQNGVPREFGFVGQQNATTANTMSTSRQVFWQAVLSDVYLTRLYCECRVP